MQQITINNITYNIIKVDTPETVEANGYTRVAEHMRSRGIENVYLQRPKGQRVFLSVFHNGLYGTPIKLW